MATTAPTSLVVLHEAFARRMKQACDANEDIPPLNEGRLVWMQQHMADAGHEVSLQTIMRWYYGAAMPRQKKLVVLAKILAVSPSWLSLGRDEKTKVDTTERTISTVGAVNALAGHMQMAGVPCAFPEKGDPRADEVHFYSIIQGRQHPIYVAAGSIDRKDSHLVFQVPVKHSKTVVLVVMPVGAKSIEAWYVPPEVLDAHADKESDLMTAAPRIVGRDLVFGRKHLAPLNDFSKALLN